MSRIGASLLVAAGNDAENAFLSTWEVSGPAQQGHILSLFRRADASRLAEEDKRASVIIEADGSSDHAF